jgi:simple sugar transport system ATP-binding protein
LRSPGSRRSLLHYQTPQRRQTAKNSKQCWKSRRRVIGTTRLQAEGITKSFGETLANDAIDLELVGGEVHALLGQNGAGKSTLVGIITGRLTPDQGRIVLDGEEVTLGDPHNAAARGIATVFQELMLVASMTGLENIALALGTAPNRALRKRVVAVQSKFDLTAPLDVPVRDLEMPQRQRIELARALAQEPKVLLLDEPTSLLSPAVVSGFLSQVRELARSGLAVLLITHRLDEARSIADHLTVLRHGRKVAEHDRHSTPSNSELALEMLGVRIVDEIEMFEPSDRATLRVTGLYALDDHKHQVVDNISLTLRAGEIIGIAGVDGNGQLELLETIAGLRRPRNGNITWLGQDITSLGYRQRFERGIQFVSGDRQRYGVVPTFTIAQHFEYALGPAILARLGKVLAAYDVRPPFPSHRGDQLSGGNQQKMIVAAACERYANLLLLSYPTRGLDVQASLTLRELLVARARTDGVSMLISSSDLEELLSIAHHIVVMNRGRIVGTQTREQFDHQQLAEWFTLGSEQTSPAGRD